MNKRLIGFIEDLVEENERLEDEVKRVRLHENELVQEFRNQRKEISELKATVRRLKKEAQK
jgi:predicted RNase H-like nuclease (RuvC/YqgF family)